MDPDVSPAEPETNLVQNDPDKPVPSRQKIKSLAVLLLLGSLFVTPVITILVWAIVMKQYGRGFRTAFYIVSGLGAGLVLGVWMFLAAFGTQNYAIYLLMLSPVFAISVLPLIYTLIWPLGRNQPQSPLEKTQGQA